MLSLPKSLDKLALGLLSALLLLCLSAPAAQAAAPVTVTLPNFPITLNGTIIDNAHRQYPLLVYQGITYFPLTYHDTRYLGVESRWDEDTQTLFVNASNIAGGYQAQQQKQANAKSASAAICPYTVVIGGQTVDNSQETYPLLVFRNVTYFPMTWAYGVEQFGWQYAFDPAKGLTIASANTQPQSLGLDVAQSASYTGAAGDYGYVARLVGDNLYYQGADGVIYQSPVQHPEQAKNIFELPKLDYAPKAYVKATLDEIDGQLTLNYHQGGPTMGDDYTWVFDKAGNKQPAAKGRDTHAALGDGFTLSTYSGSFTSNQLYKKVPGQDPVAIGSPTVRYYGTPVIRGQKVTIIGSEFDQSLNADRHGLYEVDLTTNETRLLNDPSLRLDVLSADRLAESSGDRLYFVGGTIALENGLWQARSLYQLDLSTGDIKLITPLNAASPFYALAGETLYYGAGADSDRQSLYRLGEPNPINPGGQLLYLYSEQGYVIAGFKETADNDTRLLVFDQNGQPIYRSADVAQRPQIDHDRLFYITQDGRSYLTPLK